jgi:hypothetical protein
VEVQLGHELVDDYLRFVAARCRPNSVLAAGYDLKVFFTVIAKDPLDVTMTDVFEFITAQRLPVHGGNVVWLDDREQGLSARTIRRRLATLSGLYGYLGSRGLIAKSPVPNGLSVRPATSHRGRIQSSPSGPRGRYPGSLTPPTQQHFSPRCGRIATGRCCSRCSSVGSAGVKSSGCGSPISR